MNTSLLFTEYCPAFTIYDCWFVFFRKNYKTVAVCSDKNYNEHYAILLSHISNLILYANIKYLAAQVKKKKKKMLKSQLISLVVSFCENVRSGPVHCILVFIVILFGYIRNWTLAYIYWILCCMHYTTYCVLKILWNCA